MLNDATQCHLFSLFGDYFDWIPITNCMWCNIRTSTWSEGSNRSINCFRNEEAITFCMFFPLVLEVQKCCVFKVSKSKKVKSWCYEILLTKCFGWGTTALKVSTPGMSDRAPDCHFFFQMPQLCFKAMNAFDLFFFHLSSQNIWPPSSFWFFLDLFLSPDSSQNIVLL